MKPTERKFKLFTDELGEQIEILKIKTGKNKRRLLSRNGVSFQKSIYLAQRCGEINANNLRRLEKVGVKIEKIISPKDFDFIFGK